MAVVWILASRLASISNKLVVSLCVEQIKSVDKVTCSGHSLGALLHNVDMVDARLEVIDGDHSPGNIDNLFGEGWRQVLKVTRSDADPLKDEQLEAKV